MTTTPGVGAAQQTTHRASFDSTSQPFVSTDENSSPLIKTIQALVSTDLAPIVAAVDQEGHYPEEFLRQLGKSGGFAAAIPTRYGGPDFGLAAQIDVIAQVARECGSTAFLTWCQAACAHYLLHTPNDAARDRYLQTVISGKTLAGTGMSNAVKHLAGIENIYLKAKRVGDGYLVSGALPWVSNIDETHLVIAAASVDDGGYVMFALPCNTEGVSLRRCPEFSALEGTQTLNIRLKDVQIQSSDVIAHPSQFKAYMTAIKPGFVLSQVGLGLGIIEGSLGTIQESNITTAHVNQFLDEQGDDLSHEASILRDNTLALAEQAALGKATLIDVMRLRLATSELTLRAANSAVLHTGAKGYLMRHPAQRRLREAVFVAIVTPALKHLRKEIHALEQASAGIEAA